jgi:MFS family permease
MLEHIPLWLVVALLFAAMMIAYEAGRHLHRRLRKYADAKENGTSDESYTMSGVFGLLALLMAFSFSLALNRYEERRHLVIEEANALSTFASRLSLLPQADRTVLRHEATTYAAARFEVGAGETGDPARPALARALAAHERLSSDLYAALARFPADARTTVLVQAFNPLGDIATERRAARNAHLPGLVLGLLALYCVVGGLMLGYLVAGAGAHHHAIAGAFFLLLAFAFATILDLDRPRGGMILVPQDEMQLIANELAGSN